MNTILVRYDVLSEAEQDTRSVQECLLHESEGATEEVSKIVFRAKVCTPACLYSVFCLPIINLPSWTRFLIYENNKKICQMKAALSFHWLLILHFIAVINGFLTAKHLKTRGVYITVNDERRWTWKYCIKCNLQILRKRTANFSFTSTSQKFQGNRCWGATVGWSCMLHTLCCT